MKIFYLALCLICLAQSTMPPNIIFILQDDEQHYLTFNGNKDDTDIEPSITQLANEGIVLDNHYTHWHCSPTRRSFLTGRLPIHHGENLSGVATNEIDLRWQWISDKLAQGPYHSVWFGKGHTGYKSMYHLPSHHNFKDHMGYLSGAQSYTSTDRWDMNQPSQNDTYSSDLYGELALNTIKNHNPNNSSLFLYLPYQAVHTPYNEFNHPTCKADTYKCMLNEADIWIGKIADELKSNGMWDNTLIVYSSDNGGVTDGINYPLRGEKHSNWQGGMKVAAFVSGGLIPKNLRGTRNDINMHIVDWYPTICNLAGVGNCTDNPSVPPLPVDINDPTKDIYGKSSYPPLDGVDVWDMLMTPEKYNQSSAHEYLVLSKEVIIAGKYKLLVSQPKFKSQTNGWKQPDGTWIESKSSEWPCNTQDTAKLDTLELPVNPTGKVCLFDIQQDPNEHANIADQNNKIMEDLYKQLNLTILTTYNNQAPDSLLGPCNSNCAKKHWKKFGGKSGPICAVPGCTENEEEILY